VAAESSYLIATSAQWAARGVTQWRLRQLVADGELIILRRGVYADSAAFARSGPARKHAFYVTAAMLHTQGTASHASAALLHGLDLLGREPGESVTLTRSRLSRGSRSNRNNIKIHAARLPSDHVTNLFGHPVTTPARTVIDIARASTFMHGVVTADSALHNRKTTREELASVLTYCQDWPGAARAARVLDFCDHRSESVLESCARVVFHKYGLPPPELQVDIFGKDGFIGRVDFCWPQYRTISEADGLMKYEKTPSLATDQLKRDQFFREADWKAVHFNWHQLFRETDRVISWHKTTFARTTPELAPDRVALVTR
jgi:predicted transcriptional regulator of viral defense system